MSNTNRDKAKNCHKKIGQVPRKYGKSGAHEDKKCRRTDRKACRGKIDPSEWEEDLEDFQPLEEEDENQ